MPTILAIESSCDETSASVCVDGKIISNIIATQSVHELYGGVVPELASRVHIENIVPVVHQALMACSEWQVASEEEHSEQLTIINYQLKRLMLSHLRKHQD